MMAAYMYSAALEKSRLNTFSLSKFPNLDH